MSSSQRPKGRLPRFSLAWFSSNIRLEPHYQADSNAITTDEGNNKTTFYPRGLSITWGNDDRYWKIPRLDKLMDEDSFAELKQVSWLEVTGSTKKDVLYGKSYKVSFRVSLRQDAFGWDDCEVYIMAKIGKKGKFIFKKLSLKGKPPNDQEFVIPDDRDPLIITVPPKDKLPDDDCKLYFGMYEVWSKRWKGGLKIHRAFVEMDK